MKLAVMAVMALAVVGCAERGPSAGPHTVAFEGLVEDPGRFDGREIRVEAAYYGAFEQSVLTSGFRESDPPQPVEPVVWVAAAPQGSCLKGQPQTAERVTTADRVVATGTFRFDPDGGFGHLGAYDMALEDPTLSCV